jgi:VIT1/CCC1 family predicted Fe2+/Mn2+ transporter
MPRLLDPVDRISEVLFGLMMAVTIVGSLSIASAGEAEVRTAMFAALGCNVAWGLVDAVMYVVRTATERSRLRVLAQSVRASDDAGGMRIIERALPEHLSPIVGPAEIEAMRKRVSARPPDAGALLRPRDFAEAAAIFAMVVLATFPVVLPFMLFDGAARAFRYSQVITVVMLFGCGVALGRHAGHPKPVRTGLAMAVFGVVLIAVVKALGG